MTTETQKQLGRNEPCPCGSGKKYKRCCGKDAAPKLGAPMDMSKRLAQTGLGGAQPADGQTSNPLAGFDPSQMDPQFLAQMQQAMQRMPRGQLQRLQSLMQKAMSGKDVSRDAAELERLMPPELLDLARSSPMAAALAQQAGLPAAAPAAGDEMSVDEARRLVEEAASKGEISAEQAEQLLANVPAEGAGVEKSGKFSKLWKGLTGKK